MLAKIVKGGGFVITFFVRGHKSYAAVGTATNERFYHLGKELEILVRDFLPFLA